MTFLGAVKQFARTRFPRAFTLARDAKDRLVIEWRVIRHLRPRDFGRALTSRRASLADLPSQRTRRFDVSVTLDGVLNASSEVVSGGHAVYLTPGAWRSSALNQLCAKYPENSGIKIVKNPGTVSEGDYVAKGVHSQVQRYMLHSHPHLTLVANALHTQGIGPRLYDLIEIGFADGVRVAYVSEHLEGRTPNDAQWTEGMRALRALRDNDVLAVVAPSGFDHDDFRRPDCNGNAFVDGAGHFGYVDFQNFVLGDYSNYLLRVAREASASTHYGQSSWLRGGRYLYQSVPGLNVAAKRDVGRRADVLVEMVRAAGATIDGAIVLDVGCNLGMMMAAYLRAGAAWCHGWDRAEVVPHTQRQMLAIGCTRFSLTGGDITTERSLENDLPRFLAGRAPLIVSYLAVRRHLGWLRSVTSLPWQALIYEGHEGESREETAGYLADICAAAGASVAQVSSYRDGDSEPRELAVLLRAQ
ncbi:MAG TPA: hypothetical protein VJR92_00630 [Gemmatimonadaceae bacterium]|nr:hypothetical protein [Gemmatimonadaceae bacterium]